MTDSPAPPSLGPHALPTIPKKARFKFFLPFTAFSPPPHEMPDTSAQTLRSPHNTLFSEKCLSLPSQHHLTHSQSRPLHSVRRAATALRIASWSQPLPQLGIRPGLAPRQAAASQSLPAGQCDRPAPRPRACALRELPEAARPGRRMGRRTGGTAAKVGGEPGGGRAVTPPEETFPRSRQDAALGPFQSAWIALGVFQGRYLESCRCVVQNPKLALDPNRLRLLF